MQRIKVGIKVKWNDQAIDEFSEEMQAEQKSRVYTIDRVNGEVISISDEYGEAKVFEEELIVINE